MEVKEKEKEENDYRTGCERFYERYANAEAQGFKWDYQPPIKEDYYYEYATD